MGGSSSSDNGAPPVEANNSLASDQLLRRTDVICEGIISGLAVVSGQYGSDPLCSVYFNDVPIRNGDGSYNWNISGQGFAFAYTRGTSGQAPMAGFEHVTVQLPLPPDTRLSNPPVNGGPQKQIIVNFNTNQYPDADSVVVTFQVPSLYTSDSRGNINGFEVDAQIDISLNNGSYIPLSQPIAFVGKCTTPYYRTYQFTLPKTTPPAPFYQWSLRISKTNTDIQSAMTQNALYVQSVAVISASQYNYPNTVMGGIYVDALQFGGIPATAYLVNGALVSVPSGYTPTQYDVNTSTIVPAVYPNVWDGTFTTGVWTDNPAWIFYDMVTNSRYGLGQYINPLNVDIWTLYQVSQYCDMMVDNGLGNGGLEPQFTINKFIKDPEDAYNMLLNVASAFRGMLYYGNGTINANITDNKTAVFDYTNANVVNGVFNYSSTARSARHNAIQVRYNDPLNLYRENYVLLEDNQSIIQYGYNKKEIEAFGCTTLGQATRVGNWILTTERLRTETVSFEVGEDGLYLRPGDVFNLYDNFRMNRNQGGRVAEFDDSQTFITLDRPVNLDSGCIYALSCLVPAANYDNPSQLTGSDQIPYIRNPQIQSREVLNANLSGVTTLQVSGAFSGLMRNAVWILSATGVYTSGYVPTVFEQAPQYECLAIGQSSPGILGVTALQYNTGINYTINTGFTAIMNPVNSGNFIAPAAPTNFTGNLITGNLSNGSFYVYLNLTWTVSSSPDVGFYRLSGNAGGVNSEIGTTTSTGFTYISPVTGHVDFKVCSVGKGGAASSPQTTSFNFPIIAGLTSVDPSGIRFWELPAGFGDLEQVAMFYERPYPSVISTNVFFATGLTAPFKQVMDTSFYAAECSVISGLSISGNTVYISSASYDLSRYVSQNATAQANNTLLFLEDNELMSVGTFSGLPNGNYAFSASRGVLETSIVSHSSNTTGWLFYSAELDSFTDDSLVKVFNAAGQYDSSVATRYFQVQNNTSVLDGNVIPPSPYLSYTLPDPLPAPPTNLSVISGSGKIVRLVWTPPANNNNIIFYNIYKATGSAFSSTGLAGDTVNSFYDDIDVMLGTTYQYYVTAVNQFEQESTRSNSVYAIPQFILPSGVNPYPPSDPTACAVSSSGTYYSQDGTLLSFLGISVPILTSGAAYQNILYRKHAAGSLSGSQIAAQVSNFSGPTVVGIYDLTPNVVYDIGSQNVSNFGLFSDIVVASNSPFTAPTGLVPPSAPLNLTGSVGSLNGVSLSWTPNTEPDIQEYGVYRSVFNSFSPANVIAYASSNHYIDPNVAIGTQYFYNITAIDWSENISGPSNTFSAIPTAVATGNNLNPPANPGTPTLSSSGTYLAGDGTLLSDLTFTLQALTSGAAYQNLLYRVHSSANNYFPCAQVYNSGVTAIQTVFDLTPGTSYDVAVQEISNFGILSNIVTATNSPFIAPSGTIAPATPTNLLVSGGLGGVANFLALSWNPNTEANFDEYGIYKSVNNTIPSAPFAFTPSNTYVDATVTGGITYLYWISAFNRSDVQSSLSSPASGSTENPPSAPIAPTLATNSWYLASDGTQLSYLKMGVSPLPSGAAGQYLLYRLQGNTSYQIGNDLNNTTSTFATINDLTAGSGYDVGIQAYSINGISTSVVPAVGSPYIAQSKNTPPNPISLFTDRAPTQADGIPPAYEFLMGAIQNDITPVTVVAWTLSPDKDISYQRYVIVEGGTRQVVASGTLPANQSGTYFYQSDVASQGLVRGFSGAAVDRNGNQSAWVGVDVGGTNFGNDYAGSLGRQDFTDTQLVGLQIGKQGATSVRQVLASYPTIESFTNISGMSLEYFEVDLTNRGFNTAPDNCQITAFTNGNIQYLYHAELSYPTSAAIEVYTLDSTNLNIGDVYTMYLTFTEYD